MLRRLAKIQSESDFLKATPRIKHKILSLSLSLSLSLMRTEHPENNNFIFIFVTCAQNTQKQHAVNRCHVKNPLLYYEGAPYKSGFL